MPLQSASARIQMNVSVPLGNVVSGTAQLGYIAPAFDFGPALAGANTSYVVGMSIGTSNTSIDLNTGTILQPDNITVASFSKILAIGIQNAHASAVLTLGSGGTFPIAGLPPTLNPGAAFLLIDPTAGLTVTNSTADKLNIQSSVASTPVNIFLVGIA